MYKNTFNWTPPRTYTRMPLGRRDAPPSRRTKKNIKKHYINNMTKHHHKEAIDLRMARVKYLYNNIYLIALYILLIGTN